MGSSSESKSASAWARSESFSSPVKWGEIEKSIFSQRLEPARDGVGRGSMGGAAMLIPAVFGGIFVASPVIGAGLIVAATRVHGRAVQEDLLAIAMLLFVVSLVTSFVGIGLWWQTRTRWMPALVGGVLGLVGSATALVAGLGKDVDLPAPNGLELVILAAGAAGLALAAVQVTAKPEGVRDGVPRSSRAQKRCYAAREEVVDVLVERGIVELTDDQRSRMRKMPVGTWHKFDVQGRV